MEDDDIVKEVPNDWWMTHSSCLQLLAVLVHCSNPDIARNPTVVADVDTRKTIWEKDAAEMIKDHIMARVRSNLNKLRKARRKNDFGKNSIDGAGIG